MRTILRRPDFRLLFAGLVASRIAECAIWSAALTARGLRPLSMTGMYFNSAGRPRRVSACSIMGK